MKTLLIIGGLLISLFSFSQNTLDEELQAYFSNYKNFDFEEFKTIRFKHLRVKNESPRDRYTARVSRDLDFGVCETRYELILHHNKGNRYSEYYLNVFSKDSIVIGIISMSSYPDGFTSYFDEDEINDYISKHDSLYGTNTSKEEFIADLKEGAPYGYSCGNVWHDTPQKYGLKFNDFNNIDTFRKWLRSYKPEMQTYGVDALSYLYKDLEAKATDDELTTQDKELIQHIKNRNSLLECCAGDIFGIRRRAY